MAKRIGQSMVRKQRDENQLVEHTNQSRLWSMSMPLLTDMFASQPSQLEPVWCPTRSNVNARKAGAVHRIANQVCFHFNQRVVKKLTSL